MEQTLTLAWTCLLGAGLILAQPPDVSMTPATTVERPPQLIGCVFQNRANVTCSWEAGDARATHYTLEVERIPANRLQGANSPLNMFTCTTSGTSCTIVTNSSVRFDFCISITAHSDGLDVSSRRRCQSARKEVMLPPVPLDDVKPVRGKPQCLNVTWTRTLAVFPVSLSEVRKGLLESQIEFTSQGQLGAHVKNVTVTDTSFLVCLFKPYSSSTVRLRHRFQGPESPWSPWSNSRQGRTAEHAPSAAPAFWRRVKETDRSGWRLILLLWKPLSPSLANGRVLFLNVTCQTHDAQVLQDHGSCKELNNASTSCSLRLPAGRCSCALTASTSAGASPEARIWLSAAFERELPPPHHVTVSPLDDSRLDVRWTAPVAGSAPSGFVVEWFVVRERNSSILHWKMLNSSCTAVIITEGVEPMERYVVSIKALFGERGVGQNKTEQIYTRQAAPSAGPTVKVQQITGHTVELRWDPVPVELLHGFIRNYTVSYATAGQPAQKVLVPAHTHHYFLKNLLPDNYDIFMQANTDGGAGAPGPGINVHIGQAYEDISMLMCVALPLVMTSLALVMMACLAKQKMLKQKLCQDIPDPSNSTLAKWTNKMALERLEHSVTAETTDVQYSKVVLLGRTEPQSPEEGLAFQSFCTLQKCSSHCYSPLLVSAAHTPQHGKKSEKKSVKISTTRAKTTSDPELFSYPVLYTRVLFPESHRNHPTPILHPSYLQIEQILPPDRQQSPGSVSGVTLQPGGDSELSRFLQNYRNRAAPGETFPLLLEQHQIPASRSDFSSTAHASTLISDLTSPRPSFSQSLHNLAPSLQPCSSLRSLWDTHTEQLSPFSCSPIVVDFSYCPLEWDPEVSDVI